MSGKCKKCGSFAFNLERDGIDQGDLCDVHYWQTRAETIEARTIERCAQICDERGDRLRCAANLPDGDRDEFYCADDIRRLKD